MKKAASTALNPGDSLPVKVTNSELDQQSDSVLRAPSYVDEFQQQIVSPLHGKLPKFLLLLAQKPGPLLHVIILERE